ncbi:hypothetical protein [Sphingobacterium thalpophilum]|uniref:hypothetical protein n=1 Tax=Sphingobacterium thalpophilum TaxID=259 RepID=UPI0024A6D6DA|nr:hypothetical protein [Sphingobacterium thalpophilum]
MAWFSFTGTNPTEPSHYTNVGDTPPSCGGDNSICAVQATPNSSNRPQLTDALKNEMIIALNSRTPSSNVLLKS